MRRKKNRPSLYYKLTTPDITENGTSFRFVCIVVKRGLRYKSKNDEISRIARCELDERKWNKPNLLPLASDLQVLQKHLKGTQLDSINRLANNNDDVKMYRHLCTLILTRLTLFNHRRGGEPPVLLTIKEFDIRATSVINEEVKKSLSPFELQLCKLFIKIDIRGK